MNNEYREMLKGRRIERNEMKNTKSGRRLCLSP